jgi:hypothetical protein
MRALHLNFLLDKRTIRFLKILSAFEGKSVYLLRDLSEATEINERTLLADIKNLRLQFEDCLEIEGTRIGYQFNLLDPCGYAEAKRELIAQEPLFVVIESILSGELLSYEEWADHFFLSESSMRRHLLRVSEALKPYQLRLSINPVDLIGEEGNIRKFLKDFYYEADEISPFTLKPSVEIHELMHHLEENRYQPPVGTDILPTDFYYQFYIMIYRSSQKKYLSIPEIEALDWNNDKTYQFLISLKPKIEKRYGFIIPDTELLALYLFAICKRTITSPSKEDLFCQQFNRWPNITILARKFIAFYDPVLADPIYTTTILIESFFTSVKYLDQLAPIMNKNITEVNKFARDSYPDRYKRIFSFLRTNLNLLEIGESYIADIAASLLLTVEAIRDSYDQNSKRIAFLLEGSSFVCRSVKAKALRYFRGYHELYFPTIEQIDNQFFYKNQIDIFVTNYADYVSYLEKDMDYILFHSIPNNDDWNHLLERINPQITNDFYLNTLPHLNE